MTDALIQLKALAGCACEVNVPCKLPEGIPFRQGPFDVPNRLRRFGSLCGASACSHTSDGTRGAELGAFLKANVAANSHLLTDGFAGYRGRDAGLGAYLKHTPVVQNGSANAGEFFPIIHTLFSNIKAWLVGTHHGVSAKHLPRYLREWSYRFDRRNLPVGLDRYLIRRAVECATITYDQLTASLMPAGATRVRRLPATVGRPALA